VPRQAAGASRPQGQGGATYACGRAGRGGGRHPVGTLRHHTNRRCGRRDDWVHRDVGRVRRHVVNLGTSHSWAIAKGRQHACMHGVSTVHAVSRTSAAAARDAHGASRARRVCAGWCASLPVADVRGDAVLLINFCETQTEQRACRQAGKGRQGRLNQIERVRAGCLYLTANAGRCAPRWPWPGLDAAHTMQEELRH